MQDLFEKQKELLDTFVSNGAITKAQYEKSLGDLYYKMKGIKEVWSIEYEEARIFVLSLGLSENADGMFFSKNLEVRLHKAESKKLGSVSLPQTELIVLGSKEEAEAFHNRFKLNFLKGGG